MNIVDDNYSMTYELGSTNYATAPNEEKTNIIQKYNTMINTLSDNEHFQLTLLVSKVHSLCYISIYFMDSSLVKQKQKQK